VTSETVADEELRVERFIAAPPETVYLYWTDPQRIVRWWGPEGYDIPAHTFEVRRGGRWRTTMRSPDGGLYTVSGIYRELVPATRLVFTWAWEGERGERCNETEVTITFQSTPGGTRLLVQQRPFADIVTRDHHAQGWQSALNCLVDAF
jgi:uncharacterized protein YndB with AHSA1/START domain